MEGYTENGAGTDVTDQIGFAGMRRKKKQRRGWQLASNKQ